MRRESSLDFAGLARLGSHSRDNPSKAAEIGLAIIEAAASLKHQPERGRWDRRRRFRELILAPLPYLIAYQVSGGEVLIIRIWHGRQKR